MYRAVENTMALSANAATGAKTNINNALAVSIPASLRVVIVLKLVTFHWRNRNICCCN